MSLIDLASLVLAPTATKEGKVYSAIPDTGEGDMTFTRGSAATRVNSEGLIEKERGNLLLQSNTFSTTWSTVNASVTSGQSGYDGSSDAWLLEKSASAGYLRQNNASSNLQTYSIYAKSGTLNWVVLESVVIGNAYFDLQNGVVGNASASLIDKNIDSIGNGWYRVSITYNATISQVRVFPADSNGSVSGTSGNILIQDAMLNQGLVAQSYIPTTTSAVYEGITDDVPRVDYSGGGCPSLLLEPSRTNKLPQSEYFEDSGFASGDIPFEGGHLAPDGTNSAYKITATTKSSAYLVYATLFDANDARSIYAKTVSGTGTTQLLSHHDNTNNTFTLTEEWQRFEVTSTPSVSANFYPVDFRGSTTLTEVIIWGGQAEAGSYSTSYIPTYSVSSTRVADSCSKTGISELIGQSEGTMFVECSALADDATNRKIALSDGTTSNSMYISYKNYTNQLRVEVISSGSSVFDYTYSVADITEINKIALAYKANDFAFYVDGTQVATDTSGAVPSSLSQFKFDNGAGGNVFFGKVNQAILLPTRLTNDQLEELTK